MTFDELYQKLLAGAMGGGSLPQAVPGADQHHLEYLLHPERHPPVWVMADCSHCGSQHPECCAACLFQAIERDSNGAVSINAGRCVGCASCLSACRSGTLAASRDILPALDAIKHAKGAVYALIAPSFHGQFSSNATPGQLRSAFMALGFTDMVEVALFADILTLKEAMEFDRHIHSNQGFQLASCCCPVWISMIRNIYEQLIPHMPGAVSPMIAAGRTIKALHADALTVFVGPCLAKKAEAREPDLRGAVDLVLTYEEMQSIFKAADVHPEKLEDAGGEHSSRAGRLYGRAGGVSEAVCSTLSRLRPGSGFTITACHAAGVSDCKAMIEKLLNGGCTANFYEGMGCAGGCVGGPKAILSQADGRKNVDAYSEAAAYRTPLDNPYVAELLQMLEFQTIEDFLANSDIYVRSFAQKSMAHEETGPRPSAMRQSGRKEPANITRSVSSQPV